MAIIVKSPSCDHYPRVATIQESVKWQLLSKALLGSTIQGWPLSKSQLSDNYCQKLFLGALSKGQLGVFKLISIRGTLSKHLYRYLPGRGVGVPGGGSPLFIYGICSVLFVGANVIQARWYQLSNLQFQKRTQLRGYVLLASLITAHALCVDILEAVPGYAWLHMQGYKIRFGQFRFYRFTAHMQSMLISLAQAWSNGSGGSA